MLLLVIVVIWLALFAVSSALLLRAQQRFVTIHGARRDATFVTGKQWRARAARASWRFPLVAFQVIRHNIRIQYQHDPDPEIEAYRRRAVALQWFNLAALFSLIPIALVVAVLRALVS